MWRASTVLYSPTIVVAMLVLTAAVVAASPTTIEASPAVRNDSGIDLAGMALRPTDLEAAGLRDYGRTNGIMTNDPRVAADFLKGYRGDAEGATGIGLEAADPERAYVLNLVQPGTPGNPLSGTARRVVSYILAFQDAAAAEAAFPVLATAWQRGGMRAQPTAVAVGDDRVFVAGSGREEQGNRSQYDRVDLLFRIQDLVTGVSVEDYVETPRQALVEALAERQAARVEDILGGDGPGLSQQIVRLRVPGENAISDGYAIVDAEPLRGVETAAAFDARRATPARSGMVDQYLLEQQVLGTLSSSERPLAFYVMGLTRFVDEDGASAFLRGAADRLPQGGREDVKEVPGAPDLGDGTAAFTYRHTRPDGVTFDDYRIYVRNGSDVFSMAFNTTEALEPAGVDGLAALQLACLEGTACLDPIPVPATLDRSMNPQGSPAASTSPAPLAAGMAHVVISGSTNADLTLPFVPSDTFPTANGSYDLQWQDATLDTLNVTLDLSGGRVTSGFVAVGAPGTSIYDTTYFADFFRSQCQVAVTRLEDATVEGDFTCSQLTNADDSAMVDVKGEFSAIAPPPSPTPSAVPSPSNSAPPAASPDG